MITLICISGDRGVGKSTLARHLAKNAYLGAVLVEEHTYGCLREDLEIDRRMWIGPDADIRERLGGRQGYTLIVMARRMAEVAPYVRGDEIRRIDITVYAPTR